MRTTLIASAVLSTLSLANPAFADSAVEHSKKICLLALARTAHFAAPKNQVIVDHQEKTGWVPLPIRKYVLKTDGIHELRYSKKILDFDSGSTLYPDTELSKAHTLLIAKALNNLESLAFNPEPTSDLRDALRTCSSIDATGPKYPDKFNSLYDSSSSRNLGEEAARLSGQ